LPELSDLHRTDLDCVYNLIYSKSLIKKVGRVKLTRVVLAKEASTLILGDRVECNRFDEVVDVYLTLKVLLVA